MRSLATRAWSLVAPPPRATGRSLGAPFSRRARGVRMQLDDRAVQAQRIPVQFSQQFLRQLGQHPRQHARLRPAVEPHVDRVPGTEALRQTAPLATVFSQVEQRVQHLSLGNRQLAARFRQQRRDPRVLRIGQFHHITQPRRQRRPHSAGRRHYGERALASYGMPRHEQPNELARLLHLRQARWTRKRSRLKCQN